MTRRSPWDGGGAVCQAMTLRAAQQPRWPDPALAAAVTDTLSRMPPVVTADEAAGLLARLAWVAEGRGHVVTSGDCAETFAGSTPAHIAGNLRVLGELAAAMRGPRDLPVVRIGRLAGQYAKPRTAAADETGVPSYRGDAINAAHPSGPARMPDPRRMLRAYAVAVAARDCARSLSGGPGGRADPVGDPVYLGHEALLLDYECGLLRHGTGGEVYGSSGHFLWVGERTRQPGGAHLAFAAAVANPVGVKLGPAATPAEAAHHALFLNPGRLPGRLTLITRLGARAIGHRLPGLIDAVQRTRVPVVWQCDPMHGNTVLTSTGLKTRHLGDVLAEVRTFFDIHRRMGSHPGGVHVEATGDDVTECAGAEVTADDVPKRYWSACDPRLNPAQVRELAELLRELAGADLITAAGSTPMTRLRPG